MRAATLLCLLLLASCTSPPRNSVRLAIYPLLDWYPFYLATSLGHFRDEGIEVAIEEINQGSKIMEALVAGSVDVSADGLGYAMLMAAQGHELKNFWNAHEVSLALLVVSPSRTDHIRGIADLKGSIVGIGSFGGNHYRMLLFYLHRAGLKESDVRPTVIGTSATSVAALQHGKVDVAMINSGPFRLLKKQLPGVRVLVDPRSPEQSRALFGVDKYPGGVGLIATGRWLSQNPRKARQLARAMRRTLEWIHGHSVEDVYGRIPAHLRSDDREVDLEHLRLMSGVLSKDGRMPAGGPEAVQRVMAASMNKAMSINLAATWTNEFLEAQ